jgi:hypothetical protein
MKIEFTRNNILTGIDYARKAIGVSIVIACIAVYQAIASIEMGINGGNMLGITIETFAVYNHAVLMFTALVGIILTINIIPLQWFKQKKNSQSQI